MCRFRPARSTSRSSTSASDAPVRGDGRRIARPPRAEAGVTNIPYFQVFYGTALVRSFFLLPLPSNAEKTPAPMCGRGVTAPNHDRNPAPTSFRRADARDPVCRRHRAADPHLHGGSAALRRLLPGSRCGDEDDGAFSARHDVDNFCFCPYMGAAVAEPEFRAVVLGVLETFVTSCRCGAVQRVLSLRAPPGL